MNIPEKVKIGWKEYNIEHTEKQDKLVANGDTCYGEIDYDEQVIRLNDNFSNEQKKATLIHEVLHGISDMYTLDMNEDLVTKLANAIYTVTKDNFQHDDKVTIERQYVDGSKETVKEEYYG